ncbi:MAG: hypothetical protein ACOCZK_03330 [Planctomycetota bacterium]
MRLADLVEILAAFEAAHVRYLIVGGYAVIGHGHVRTTLDLDLVVDLEGDQPGRVVAVLDQLGYRPRAPVPLADFANSERRRAWLEDKGAQVFTVVRGDGIAHSEVDVFLQYPFAFAEAYAAATVIDLPDGTPMRIVDIERLKAMKRAAARPQDLGDLAALDAMDAE